MILYGNLISNFTKVNKIPVPYRVQQRIDKVANGNIQDSDNKVLYNFVLKKTMGKSYYSINPMPHEFRINILFTCHITDKKIC